MRRVRVPGRRWLWPAFVAVNVWLCVLALWGPGFALGDVSLYRWWVELGFYEGTWVGIDTAWVYPIGALLPMVMSAVAGFEGFIVSWLMLVVFLNGAALAALTGWTGKARNVAAGWWWCAFLLVLGPIAVGRVDSISVPLAIVALSFLAAHPVWSGVLLALATWIKVWPAAVIAAIILGAKERWKAIVGVVLGSATVVGAAVALGGAGSILSFVTQQTGRGLQIEAPIAAPWLWMAVGGVSDAGLYYDRDILTYQVSGPGVDVVAQLMTPLLAVAAIAVCTLAVWLLGRGARPAALLPPLMLALVLVLVVVNKVGSPQFMTWLAAPIIFGLIASGIGRTVSFRFAALLGLVIAGLTQLVYPVLYGKLLALEPLMVATLTVRNLLLVVLLVWAVRAMMRVPRGRRFA